MVQKVMERSFSPEKAVSRLMMLVTNMLNTTPMRMMVCVLIPRSAA